MAKVVGDTASIAPLQQSLADEEAMGQFIQAQTIPTTERFMALTRAGEKAGV